MPSIFEQPSLLGFRADGGEIDNKRWEASKLALLREVQRVAQERGVDINDILQGNVQKTGVSLSEIAQKITSPGAGFGNTRPVFTGSDGSDVDWGKVALSLQNETPQALSRFAPMLQGSGDAQPATPAAATPTAQQPTSMFGPPAPGEQIFGPPSIFAGQQPQAPAPAGSRAENIAAAKASGDFGTKVAQYNQEAQRLGHPTMMDGEGNIVPRELSEPEKMREFFDTTGGNTMFSQTNDPAQRALQMEMMRQSRAKSAANTFGSTPEERLANLQAETDARKLLQSPLNSGVREVAPGVRAATKDGQMIGFSAPGDGSPATMNDPLKRYITNPDGSVSLNPNPPQILMSDEMKDTAVRQGIEGKTGGSQMERAFLAALAAEEAKKKAAASAPVASAPPAIQMPPSSLDTPSFGVSRQPPQSSAPAAPAPAQVAAPSAPAQSQIPPEFRVRPGADAAFDAEVAALEQRRADALAPGFKTTSPSGQFAENFGYGTAPAPGFNPTDPSGRFAEIFGYGSPPAPALPPAAFGSFDPRSRPVSSFPVAAAPVVTVPSKTPVAPVLAAAPSTTGSLVGSIFTDPKTKQRKIW